MDYTAIPSSFGWEAWSAACGLLGALALSIIAISLSCLAIEGMKRRSIGKNVLAFTGVGLSTAIMVGAWWGGVSFTFDKVDTIQATALETMKSNLNAKYVIDLSNFDVEAGENGPARGDGTYTFRNKDASSVVKFSAEFDESGEPFIVVNEYMTREDVEEMLR